MFASAAKRLLPSDVYRYLVANAALLLTAPRVAKPRQKASRAESSIGLDLAERFEGRETLTYQEAVATLVALAQELADKPPPTPEEADSTGLAGSTYRPTLDYLAQVHTYGADAVAPEVHASMARMLELHKKQLNYRIMPVLDALDTSIQEEVVRQGRVAAPRSGKGSLKIYSPDEESFAKLGQYRWNARNRTLEVETSYELYKGGFRVAQALAAQGLEKGVHFVWRERWIEGRYARKVLYLEVKPEYVEEVAHALEEVAPEFARALLANAEIWRQRAGVTRKEPKAAQPSTEAERAAAVLQDGNSPEEGTIAVPEGMTRKFRWFWDPSNPEVVTLWLPVVWTDESRIPLASALIEQSGIPAQRGAREEGYPITVQVLPFAKVARMLLESSKFPGTVEALKVLYPVWKAAASKTHEQRAATVTAEERKMAATLARRFQHMMGGQRSTPEVQEQLAAAIPLLRGVQPGATSADLGLYGSWRVDSTPDPKHPKVPIRTLVIRLASYPTMEVLSGLLGAQFRKAGSAYELGVALKRAPAVARALDEPNPVLAMSLRLGLLTDSAVKSCHELEILSSALTLQDIPDDGLRTQVQQIERQLDLKALITDADGRKHTARPSPYQTIGMAFAHFAGGRALIADTMGLGKGGRPCDKILTPHGWTTYGEIKVGDKVIGSNGKAVEVTGVFHRGFLEVFRVTMSDGSSTVCDADHLWAVNSADRRYHKRPYRVWPLKRIKQKLRDGSGNSLHFIPMVQAVEFEQSGPLPLDPYVLGYLLGNGALSGRYVGVSIPDDETVERLQGLLPSGDSLVYKDRYDWIVKGGTTLAVLRSLGLLGKKSVEKWIPPCYQFASVTSRVALLQGLLDSDGYAGAGKNIEYSSSSQQLAQSVLALVQSLGGVASFSTRLAPKYEYNGEMRTGQPNHRLNITLPPSILPFRLTRKASAMPPREKYFPCRAIVSVESIGTSEVICIAVNAADSLYVTDDYIVTHNTLQAIGFMLFEDAFPALVVCPATAVWNWVTEIKRWTDRPLEIIVVETATDPIPDVRGKRAVIVVSADMMRRVADALVNRQLRLVVFDEAHYFKNSASQRAEAAKRVAHNTPMVLLLSGTALENRVPDLWHLLHMLDPRGFPTLAAFKAKYANANKRSIEAIDPDTGEIQLMEYDDDRRSTSLDELRDTLRCIMVRRLKNEVLTDLPLKTRIVHQLKGLDLRAYRKAEAEMADLMIAYARRDRIAEAAKRVGAGEDIDEVVQEINARDFTNPVKYIIVVLNRLRQLAGEAKAGAAAAWALEFLRTKRRPLVIFVEHQPVLQVLGEALSAEGIRWTYIDGVVPGKERFKRVNEFQDGKYEVIICTKAAREAITLTRARDELFVEFWWVPAWMEQAEDRIHRRGQTGEVTINYLEAPNTTDAHIRELIIEKQADIEKVMRADDYEESDEAAKVEAPITEIMAKEMLRRIEDRVQIGSTAGLDFTAEDVEDAMATVEDDKPKRKRRKKQ